jgi:hypothetical protein
MADILVTCDVCGHDHRISEYADPAGISCADCGGELSIPERNVDSPLRLKTAEAPASGEQKRAEPPPISGEVAAPVSLPEADQVRTDLNEVYQPREKEKKPPTLLAWLAFMVLAGVMVWMQMGIRQDPHLFSTYNWVRIIAGALIYLLVIVVAFEDHLWQGLLTLFIPPYSIYYALVRLDSQMLRNLFLALMVAFAAEMYFIPSRAFAAHVQQGVNDVINSGEGAIQRAGDAPTFD